MKTASDLYAPLTGEVIEVNQSVVDEPSQVNDSPYEAGWLIKLRADDQAALQRELSGLLDSEAYAQEIQ